MPARDWTLLVADILDAVQAIEDYTAAMGYDAFAGDRKTVDAVLRNLAIIGEAARHVPDGVTRRIPRSRGRTCATCAMSSCTCILV